MPMEKCYGDPLNPWGDILAGAQAWCVSKKKAKLAIGVPTMVVRGQISMLSMLTGFMAQVFIHFSQVTGILNGLPEVNSK